MKSIYEDEYYTTPKYLDAVSGLLKSKDEWLQEIDLVDLEAKVKGGEMTKMIWDRHSHMWEEEVI